MTSLGLEIAKLSDPKPINFDDEDDNDNLEGEKITDETITFQKSELRSRVAPLLEDVDTAYTGRKVSRKSRGLIFNETKSEKPQLQENVSVSSDNYSDSDEESEDIISDDNIDSFRKNLNKSSDCEEEELSTDSVSDEETEGDKMVSQFANIDVNNDIEKGKAIKAQEEIWNKLCEARIKLQKLLIIANKLPQTDDMQAIKERNSEEIKTYVNKDSDCLKQLLNNLINLQSELNNKHAKEDESLNEMEIPSDVEENKEIETGEPADNKSATARLSLKRKLKDEDYNDVLSKQFKSDKSYRNLVIQKWDDKVRLSTGRMTQKSFDAFGNSAVKQIDQVLQDKTRLIKRTQLKRSVYRILGKSEISLNSEQANESATFSKQDMLLKDYDPQIFDDDDFYRQLLKDIIQSKSFGLDPSIVRKQMELQSIRNKMKRKVDTKASKGRKLRYDVHPKLVNFMAPVQTCTISEDARENLLKCLFGKSSAMTYAQ